MTPQGRVEEWSVDAAPVAAAADRLGRMAAVGLADGTVAGVAWGEETAELILLSAHPDGAVLDLCADVRAGGFLSSGDDGLLRRIHPDGLVETLFDAKGRWIDAVTASGDSGVIACAVGKTVRLLQPSGVGWDLPHDNTAAAIALDARGRRLGVARYNGVDLWWTASEGAPPKRYAWKGSHIGVSFHPDNHFVMTATQDAELHGWRLSDGKDVRMSGYSTKVKSLSWTAAKPRHLATSGGPVVVCWSFSGDGPMGKPPIEFGEGDGALVSQVACHPKKPWVAAGYADGAIRLGDLQKRTETMLRPPGHGAVEALIWSPDGRKLVAACDAGRIVLISF